MARAGRDVVAAVLFAAFSAYLFEPYFESFHPAEYLIPFNCLIGAAGAYILSKRWVAGFGGRFFCGSVYGFGPFMLFLASFHPTAGSIAAVTAWLFIPAVLWLRGKNKWLRMLFALLPFVVMLVLFEIAGRLGLYPVPTQIRLQAGDLISIIAPAAMVGRADILLGFYHICIAGLFFGLMMLAAAQRYKVVIVFAAAVLLSIFDSYSSVPAIMWLAVPVLCCSVIICEGLEGIIHCGYSDRRWVLTSGILLLILAVVSLLFGTKAAHIFAGMGLKYTRLFTEAAKMYIVGAVAVGVVYFLARGRSRLVWLRAAVLYSAVALDVFFGARLLVDSIM